MLQKLKRVFIAATILVAGGLGIREALHDASVAEGMSCAEWIQALSGEKVQNRPEYLPVAQFVKEECPALVINVQCAYMPDGTICHKGYGYKQGNVSAHPPGHPDYLDEFRCDPSLGIPIPCTGPKRWWKQVRDGTYDKRELAKRIRDYVIKLADQP